jgi:hypothetical protein
VAGELDAFLRELQAGIPPEGALADREFVIPEGFPVEAAKEIWHSVALLVSCGASDEEVREALALLDKRVKLPGEIKMGDDNFTIRYDQARVGWEDDGRVFVDIPIETPLLGGVSANMVHIRSIAVSGRLHLVYRITEERLYRLRRRLEGYYRISYRDLETGKNYSVVSRLTLGVYPEFGISTGASGSEIPPGSIFNFGKYTPGFLVAVPGHYEDVDALVPEHYEKFKVLFPAYDPVLYTGWIVDTSISSSNVELHDVLTISYEAYPVNIDPDDEPLNANLYLGAPGSFEPLDGVVAELNNTHRSGSFRLRANAAGTYDVTLNLSGNACFGGWPPQTSTTYVVNVVGPSSPEVEIEFTGVEPSFKHASVDVNVKNDGAGDAHNITLDISGNVDPLSFGVGELKAGLSWSNRITLRLRSASARVRACATYFDDSGNRYVSDRYITIVSPNYVVPEHFEEYTLKVPEHFEKVRVFVPGYEGYTHVKIYHPYCTFYYPSGLGLGGPGVVLSAEGVEVHTTFLPIADEGFELTFVPKELKMNILGEVLVGPNIPASGVFTTTAQVRYLVTSVTPAFEEFVVDERKAREMLGLSGVGEIKAEEVPAGYEAALESTIVKRERLWLNETEYRRVAEEGFGRLREGFYYYEDGGEAIWPSADSARSLSGLEAELFGNKIRLIYHPLELHEGNSVRGISLRNYASRSLNYSVQVEPVSLLPASAKAQSGSIVAPAASCLELSMFQLVSDVTFIVSLRYGDRQVARLYLMRTLAVPPYCQGFIRGFLSKAPSIAIPVCFLGIAAIAPSSVVRGLSYAVIVAKAIEVYSQREQLIGAALTLANLTALSMEHNRLAAAYAAMGKPQLARKALETSASLSAQALDVAKDLGLGLFVGVDPQELKVALGYTEANEYERGYAAGRVAGSIVAAVAYVGTFTVLYDKLVASGGAGQLSTASILSRVGRGLYNWLTPSIWDLAELGMAKVRGLTVKHAAEVMLADQIDRGFGSVAGEAARALLTDGGKADVAEAVADIVERATLDGELPEDVAAKLLAALEPVGRAYVGDGEWGAKVRRVAYDVIEVWKRDGAVGDALMDWFKLAEDVGLKDVVESGLIGELSKLGKETLEDLGKAWELNRKADDFNELLKGINTALELRETRQGQILTLFHKFIETNDPNKVAFLSRTLGWMSDVRDAFLLGDPTRTNVVDNVIGLIESSGSKLDGSQMLRISGILENLLNTRGKKDAYSLFVNYFHDHLFEYAKLKDKVEMSSLEDCLRKWELASTVKDARVSLMRYEVVEGSTKYQANTPEEVNYICVSKDLYIPVIATQIEGKSSYIVGVPKDAQEYLRASGYLPKETGLVLFTKSTPENARLIVPVVAEGDGKITLTEWLKRFIHKYTDYRVEYLISTGRDYVLDWDQLDEDHMVLVAFIRKLGTEFKETGELNPSEYCRRTIMLKPRPQNIIRTRVGEIARAGEIVLCEFQLKPAESLSVDEALDIFRNQYDVEEAVAQDLANRLSEVMLYTDEEGEGQTDTDLKGRWTEWKYFQIIQKYDKVVGYQKKIEGTKRSIDFVTKSNLLIDSKFRKKFIREEIGELFEQIISYKKEWEKYEAEFKRAKVVLSFYQQFSDSDYKYLESKIEKEFGNNWEEWLKVCNGLSEFEDFVIEWNKK